MEGPLGEVTIDWEWVRRHLSARERLADIGEGQTKEAIAGELTEALRVAKSKAAPRISFVKKAVLRFNPASVDLEGGIRLSSRELSSHMKGAAEIGVFLVTIGKGVEEAATSYMNSGDHLLGYLLDRAGSFAAESMAKNAEGALRRGLAKMGMSVSMRFSPGYCDWPIEEQRKLAKIMDFGKAGVTLSENCVMIPKKSISAVAGIGPKELFSKVVSPCAVCNMSSCGYRRKD